MFVYNINSMFDDIISRHTFAPDCVIEKLQYIIWPFAFRLCGYNIMNF